jgi:Fur family ferric uptake transcriptional regulator
MAVPASDQEQVSALLRARGLRMTPQRRAIVAEIMRTQGHISPVALTRTVRATMPGVNRSTVYRTLATLEEAGVLRHSHLESGPEYHRSDEAGHVHLVCGQCGKDDELSLDEVRGLQEMIRRHHGFEADLSHFAITGLCQACRGAATNRPDA